MKDLPFPIVLDSPGIQLYVEIRDKKFPIETFLNLLRKVGEPNRANLAMFSTPKAFKAMAVLKANSEEELKELEEKISKAISEVKGIYFEIKRLRRYGTNYLVVDAPRITLMGEPLVLIRKSRYLGYLRRICDLLDEGTYAFLRSIGEEDGEMISRVHFDALKKMRSEGNLIGIVEYVIRGMAFLENIPECEIRKRREEVQVRVIWNIEVEGRMRKALVYYLYGLLKGIFKELGAYVQEETSTEGISALSVISSKGSLRVKVEGRRFF